MADHFTTRPTLQGDFGMVSATHYQASAAAMSVLERGGTAADAAVCAGFVLHVVEPHLNGPGGDLPLLASHRGGPVRALCGQGPAPRSASAARYRALGLDLVPGSGPLAAAVPGAVDAWLVLLRDLGEWELGEVLAPAIGLAERGHFPLAQVCGAVASVAGLFRDHWTSSAEVHLPHGEPPSPSRRLRNPTLAQTWRRLLGEAVGDTREQRIEAARRAWREGFVAESMARQAGRPTLDSTGSQHAGELVGDDLAGWQAGWEEPISTDWGPWTVTKAGPWTQGPVFVQQLRLLADLAPGQLTGSDGWSAEAIHRLVEASKLAFADRDAWYGDAWETARMDALVEALLCDDYADQRRELIATKASQQWRPGAPMGRAPRVPQHVARLLRGEVLDSDHPGSGEPTVQNQPSPGQVRGDTCHVAVVDQWGTMIAATPSGGWLQSNPVIPELGFPLGTRLQMCWLDDALPNTLTPGRRPRTTLTPTIALHEATPTLAFGTPGGDQQDQWGFHFFLRLAEEFAHSRQLDLQAAIDAPNWHTDALIGSFWPRGFAPASLVIESRAGEATVDGLRRRGHRVTVAPPWSEGRLCAVGRHPDTGALLAGANPRGMAGYAAGR